MYLSKCMWTKTKHDCLMNTTLYYDLAHPWNMLCSRIKVRMVTPHLGTQETLIGLSFYICAPMPDG